MRKLSTSQDTLTAVIHKDWIHFTSSGLMGDDRVWLDGLRSFHIWRELGAELLPFRVE